jgi:hypothetical protein
MKRWKWAAAGAAALALFIASPLDDILIAAIGARIWSRCHEKN